MNRFENLDKFNGFKKIFSNSKNIANLYEDFYECYGALPIDDVTQNNMFNSFLIGVSTAMNPQ